VPVVRRLGLRQQKKGTQWDLMRDVGRWLVGDAAVPRASGRCACCSSAQGAKKPPPKVRDWMNDNSWIVSECVIGPFVIITASSQ
jgi:hypothetical protein